MKNTSYIILVAALVFVFSLPAIAGEEPRTTAEVFRYDGSRQCENSSGISLEEMAKQLESAGIKVFASRKGSDGRIYPAVCGGGTGRLNIYSIDAQQLAQAKELGFKRF